MSCSTARWGFFCGRRTPRRFSFRVEPFLRVLQSEPRLAAYVDDVLEEVVEIVNAMEAAEADLTSELRGEWADFEPEPFNADGEGGLAKALLGILRNKDTAYLH
jgi:hypothetical protein